MHCLLTATVFLFAGVPLCSASSNTTRPNLTTWKTTQEAEAAVKAGKVARSAKLAAVNKVVGMLEALRTKVLQEGETEAATYNKFACFCKDTSAERVAGIQSGESEKTSLIGNIGSLTQRRDILDGAINAKLMFIQGKEDEIKLSKETRQTERKAYTVNAADLTLATESLEGAIQTLKASKRPSLAQMESVSKTVRTATLLANALGLGSHESEIAFLQQQPEVQMEDYKFHSDDIISVLEGLEKDFRQTREEIDKSEVASAHSHDMLMQTLANDIKKKKVLLEEDRKKRFDKVEAIGAASQRLTTVEATLMADKEYTNELTTMCRNKAKTWDHRSATRADELSTLTTAIGIITDAVKGNTTAATIRFRQQGMTLGTAQAVAEDTSAMDAIEAAAEDADVAPSFVQASSMQHSMLRATARRHKAEGDGKLAVINMLKARGQKLKSTLLSSLASRLTADPFAKVKQLIQELLERLLQEAGNEANQKGWCDKAMADASQRRDLAADEVAELNGKLASFEAIRDRLAEDLQLLAEEIADISKARSKAVQERGEEKAENEATVTEARQGLVALNECMTLLSRFYKTTENRASSYEVELLATDPWDEAPDAGFDNDEAYAGDQSGMVGILGMMDVMKSDFVRTVQETEEAEEQAQQDHLEFMTVSGKTLAEKEEAESQREEQKRDNDSNLAEADESLEQETSVMRGAITELMRLKPTCIDTGMSYNERVSRREQEIESLNQALCILSKHQEFGPDGAGAEC